MWSPVQRLGSVGGGLHTVTYPGVGRGQSAELAQGPLARSVWAVGSARPKDSRSEGHFNVISPENPPAVLGRRGGS